MNAKKSFEKKSPASPGQLAPPTPLTQKATVPASPAVPFPVDHVEENRRGPGRPAKICPACNLPASECKGHAVAKFEISEGTVKGMYQMLAHVVALSFSISSGLPAGDLAKLWAFSEGETAVLAPPTAALINEKAPEWLLKYEKEIAVGFVLFPILITKLTITNALVKMHKAELEKKNPADPAAPAAAAKPESKVSAQAATA
jgi:hypothetical protein